MPKHSNQLVLPYPFDKVLIACRKAVVDSDLELVKEIKGDRGPGIAIVCREHSDWASRTYPVAIMVALVSRLDGTEVILEGESSSSALHRQYALKHVMEVVEKLRLKLSEYAALQDSGKIIEAQLQEPVSAEPENKTNIAASPTTPITTKRKQYTQYEEVPWYRRDSFNGPLIILGCLIPLLLFLHCLILLTGEVYRKKKGVDGKLLTWPIGLKLLAFFGFGLQALAILSISGC